MSTNKLSDERLAEILELQPSIALNKQSVDELRAMAAEISELRRLVQDAAPLMLTVNAYGADEAPVEQLTSMARYYVQAKRDYSTFDAWLDAFRAAARAALTAKGGAK